MARANRFRKKNVSPEDLIAEAKEISTYLDEISERPHPADVVCEGLIAYSKVRFGDKWKSQRFQNPLMEITDNTPFLNLEAWNTLNTFGLRSIPLEAQKSLMHWRLGTYNLELNHEPPDWKAVLSLQADGKRCVTFIRDAQTLQSYILGERDPLGFTVHDLLHAHRFFGNPELFRAQMGFFKWMNTALENGWMSKRTDALPYLVKYVFSDMNSHPVHMWQTLVHALSEWQREERGSTPTLDDNVHLNDLFDHVRAPTGIKNILLKTNRGVEDQKNMESFFIWNN